MPVRKFIDVLAITTTQHAGHGDAPLGEAADHIFIAEPEAAPGKGQAAKPVAHKRIHAGIVEDNIGSRCFDRARQQVGELGEIVIIAKSVR